MLQKMLNTGRIRDIFYTVISDMLFIELSQMSVTVPYFDARSFISDSRSGRVRFFMRIVNVGSKLL